jgi:multiple antibiotic resistance protein
MPSLLWSAFVTLFVTIGPVEVSAVFAGLTGGIHKKERISLALRSVVIAGVMLVLFALGGNSALRYLRVSLYAFQIAGGILLFLQALTLTFSSPGLSSITESEKREAREPGGIAVFPLAFPLIAGPGSLSAAVLLMNRIHSDWEIAALLLILALCLAITLAAMLIADRLGRLLGKTGVDVTGRISGVLLAALAVQFALDGFRQSGLLH